MTQAKAPQEQLADSVETLVKKLKTQQFNPQTEQYIETLIEQIKGDLQYKRLSKNVQIELADILQLLTELDPNNPDLQEFIESTFFALSKRNIEYRTKLNNLLFLQTIRKQLIAKHRESHYPALPFFANSSSDSNQSIYGAYRNLITLVIYPAVIILFCYSTSTVLSSPIFTFMSQEFFQKFTQSETINYHIQAEPKVSNI
ncbi:MAG: hypothetical protein SAJ37_11800 [Oscillatoria sp. PMC 1068.18]|nr:hypothetical protein [Oscillatoria sp. PMC 1068.18]